MSRVRGKDTTPELRTRRCAHAIGLRFRLHRKDLPGKPDLIFPKYKLAVFVHGCFWHRHPHCSKASTPKSKTDYWVAKFDANVARDARVADELKLMGWNVAVLWECETRNKIELTDKLQQLIPKIRRVNH